MPVELSITQQVVIAIYAIAALVAIFGGIFIHFVSGRQARIRDVGKKVLRVFFAWIIPPWRTALKIFVVVALITAGLAVMGAAFKVHVYDVQTGERAQLIEDREYRLVVGGRYDWPPLYYEVYRYNLMRFPIYTTVTDRYLEPGGLMWGLALIIAAMIVVALFLVRANNAIYLAKAEAK